MKQSFQRLLFNELAYNLNGIFDKQEGSVLVNNTRGLLSSEELLLQRLKEVWPDAVSPSIERANA
jgi:hypothetical protein